MDKTDMTEQTLSSTKVFGGKLLQVYSDGIRLPGGNEAVREYIKHPGAACVVPVNEKNEVLMVRQFRYPFRRVLLEVPAGKLDAGEDPAFAAKRELKEETGAAAAQMTYLGPFYPTCAYSDEVIHMYLATGLTFGEAAPDEDEVIEPECIPLKTLVDMVMEGKIADGKTQSALLKAWSALQS